jgi:hypothetical protein
MIELSCILRNPLVIKKPYNPILYFFITQFGNKLLELNVYKNNCLLLLVIDWTTNRHHAGFRFSVGLLGFAFEIHLYDGRHWDSKFDRYIDDDTEF